MSVAKLDPAFSQGEISPDLYGRFDLAKLNVGASTARNVFVKMQGGAASRAGLAFVGFSKQTGRDFPCRLITFQFSINQGLALEFGNFYMRVIQDGAYVTEPELPITGISQASPAVVSSTGSGATAAVPITSGVLTSYAQGERITLAGGTFLTPTILTVVNTKLLSLVGNAGGTGYVPTNTITLAGGTSSPNASLTINTTKVSATPTIANAGVGGTPGPATVTGTTGTGTKFQAAVTINGAGIISSVNSLSVAGSYTINPTSLTNEPVTGGSLTGAQLSIVMGVNTFTLLNAGIFTVNAPSGNFTQGSTSGAGTGATFQQGIFAPNSVSIFQDGVYSVTPSNPVSQASSTGSGTGATFTMTYASVAAFSDGDWVFIKTVVGMTEVNDQIFVWRNPTSTDGQLFDVYGNPIDSTAFNAYISGGTISRIYTVVSPYAEEDLKYIKWTQSRDVMSICCVNQQSLTEYPPYNLTRNSNVDWTFTLFDPEPTVAPPSNVAGSASGGGDTDYQYVVTSIDPANASESIASDIIRVDSAVNIAGTAGQISLSWTPAPGVTEQKVYKALPGFQSEPPPGSQFGFAGFAFGAQFIDPNITADFSDTPPKFNNPFAPGQVLGGDTVTAGTGYATATVTINTSTGSGAQLQAIIVGTGVVGFILITGGKNYLPTDTITISGDGTGATATLNVGPETGTYPGVVAYFQSRRVYAYTLNDPDTYFMSQPGAFGDYDTRTPTLDDDAITGTPSSTQLNGIQWLIDMPGGLVVMTGAEAWQLTGRGGSSLTPQPITPASQQAQPQAFNGVDSHVPPIKIDNDILFVQSKGAIVRDFAYQIYSNIYLGTDLTISSNHMFFGYSTSPVPDVSQNGQIIEWAWCEEPYRLLWVIRNDGVLLCLTYMKAQEVMAWTRHDTNGQFVSVCSVTEPPVDALYCAVKRYIGSNVAYTVERMNDRIWTSLDDAWCVDCGLSLPQPTPDATLTCDSSTGLGAIVSAAVGDGGTGWNPIYTTGTVIDDEGRGPGIGAVPTLTFVNGVLTSVVFAMGNQGTGYVRPQLILDDPTRGASSTYDVVLTLDNSATFTATPSVFVMGDVGSVIRMGGGVATITAYTSGTEVTANITSPILAIRPNSGGQINPQVSGTWTLTAPVSSIGGLQHLTGAVVTGVADGVLVPPVTVPVSGTIPLPQSSTNVVVGLGYTAQLQSLYIDEGEPTIQGQRKKIADMVVRVRNSYKFKVGTNQPDGSTYSPQQIAPTWFNMVEAKMESVPPFGSVVQPLYTGDTKTISVYSGFNQKGQVAVQQDLPFPLEILAFVPRIDQGDLPETKYPKDDKK